MRGRPRYGRPASRPVRGPAPATGPATRTSRPVRHTECFARPPRLPGATRWRRDQRLGECRDIAIGAGIEQQQPVGIVVAKVAEQEQRGVRGSAVQDVRAAAAGAVASQAEQVAVQRAPCRLTASCGSRCNWHCRNDAASCGAARAACARISQALELLEESGRPFATSSRSWRLVVGEVDERVDDPNSWPWNSIGIAGNNSSSAVMARRSAGRARSTSRRPRSVVGDLVVILEEVHAGAAWKAEARRAPWRLLPRVVLPLEEHAPPGAREPFAGDAAIVREVGLVCPDEGHARGVVEVLVVHRVEAVAARRAAAQTRMLRFVLGRDEDAPATGGLARGSRDGGDEMLWRRVEDLLRGIETEPVDVEFTHPVRDVAEDPFTYRSASGPSKFSASPHSLS